MCISVGFRDAAAAAAAEDDFSSMLMLLLVVYYMVVQAVQTMEVHRKVSRLTPIDV